MQAGRVVPVIRCAEDERRVGSGYGWLTGLCSLPHILSVGLGLGYGCRTGNVRHGS